ELGGHVVPTLVRRENIRRDRAGAAGTCTRDGRRQVREEVRDIVGAADRVPAERSAVPSRPVADERGLPVSARGADHHDPGIALDSEPVDETGPQHASGTPRRWRELRLEQAPGRPAYA